MEGGCSCRFLRCRLDGAPMIAHACHCRWCQRETGSVHALNAVDEAERVTHLNGEPELIVTPSESGKSQTIARCPKCKLAIGSNYAGSGPLSRFIRVGTLDEPGRCPPDVHIFTSPKQPWVAIPQGAKSFSEFYPDMAAVWSTKAVARWRAMRAKAGPPK